MNLKLGILFSLLLITGTLVLFHRQVFPIREVEIRGNRLIDPEAIRKSVNIQESLLSLDKEKLAKDIRTFPLVEEVRISLQLFDKLVIEIREKEIVAEIHYNQKRYYLTSEGLILSEKSYIRHQDFPRIYLKKKVDNYRLILVSNHLGKIKFYNKNFFEKIEEISLNGSEHTDIFIKESDRRYLLNPIPNLEDFLKVEYLESQDLQFKVLDLRGNYVIVRK